MIRSGRNTGNFYGMLVRIHIWMFLLVFETRLVKWMFTALFVTPDGKSIPDGLVYYSEGNLINESGLPASTFKINVKPY